MVEINTCRCAHVYCGKHLQDHGCTFDYLKDFQDKINPIIIAPDRVSNRI
jgi:hypothetical protein